MERRGKNKTGRKEKEGERRREQDRREVEEKKEGGEVGRMKRERGEQQKRRRSGSLLECGWYNE